MLTVLARFVLSNEFSKKTWISNRKFNPALPEGRSNETSEAKDETIIGGVGVSFLIS